MKKSPLDLWGEVRVLMRTLTALKAAMKAAPTQPLRDQSTQEYVRKTDRLVGLMSALDQRDVLAEVGEALEVVYGRVGG